MMAVGRGEGSGGRGREKEGWRQRGRVSLFRLEERQFWILYDDGTRTCCFCGCCRVCGLMKRKGELVVCGAEEMGPRSRDRSRSRR